MSADKSKSLNIKTNDERRARRQIITMSAVKSKSLNIKTKDDSYGLFISAMTVRQTGTLVVADFHNKKIKSVSPDGNISYLKLPMEPKAITVLDTTTAAVSGWDDRKLYILDIKNFVKLTVRSECQLEDRILAMTNYYDKLVLIYYTDPPCIKMITTKGVEVWSVSKDESGKNLFSRPEGITTTTINITAVIVVTDMDKGTLTLLEARTGSFMRTIHVGQGKEPRGITVDNNGNVIVCFSKTSEICVWTNDFNESKILVSPNTLGQCPQYIVYNCLNDSLYISYGELVSKGNTVDCFSLS